MKKERKLIIAGNWKMNCSTAQQKWINVLSFPVGMQSARGISQYSHTKPPFNCQQKKI
jgi:triosephosphate isomerase